MNPARFFKSNAAWALTDQIGVSACNFLSTLVVAKYLSLEGFSAFGLSLTVTLFVSALHRSYLTQPMSILGIAESREALAERFKAVLLLQLMAWPAVLLGLVLLGSRYFPSLGVSLACAFSIAMFLLQESVRRLFFTLSEIRSATAIDVVAYGGQLGLILLVGATGHLSVEGALLLMGLSFLSSFTLGLALLPSDLRSKQRLPMSRLSGFASAHWVHSRWIALSQLFMFGSYMFVPFQIAEFGQAIWVAQYNATSSVLNVLNIIRQTIGNYLPTLAAKKFHADGLRGLERMLNKVAMQMVLGAVVVIVGLLLTGDFLVHLLYGDRFKEAASILPIASVGPLIGMLSFVSQAGAMVLGKTEHIFYSYVGGAVVSFIAAPFMIPHFGLPGAVWVANMGIIVPTVWHWVEFKGNCRVLRSGI